MSNPHPVFSAAALLGVAWCSLVFPPPFAHILFLLRYKVVTKYKLSTGVRDYLCRRHALICRRSSANALDVQVRSKDRHSGRQAYVCKPYKSMQQNNAAVRLLSPPPLSLVVYCCCKWMCDFVCVYCGCGREGKGRRLRLAAAKVWHKAQQYRRTHLPSWEIQE